MNKKVLKRVSACAAALVLLIICVFVLLRIYGEQPSEEEQIVQSITGAFEVQMERKDNGQVESLVISSNSVVQSYLLDIYFALMPCSEPLLEENWVFRVTIDGFLETDLVFEFYEDRIRFNGDMYDLGTVDYDSVLAELNNKFSYFSEYYS